MAWFCWSCGVISEAPTERNDTDMDVVDADGDIPYIGTDVCPECGSEDGTDNPDDGSDMF